MLNFYFNREKIHSASWYSYFFNISSHPHRREGNYELIIKRVHKVDGVVRTSEILKATCNSNLEAQKVANMYLDENRKEKDSYKAIMNLRRAIGNTIDCSIHAL